MNSTTIQTKLIEKGVANLREFGYPDCDKDNILSDRIYSAFFKEMLQDNLGAMDANVDIAIAALLQRIAESASEPKATDSVLEDGKGHTSPSKPKPPTQNPIPTQK